MTMTAQRVTLITLGVEELSRAKAFYNALGWVEARASDGIVFFQMHGAVLGLFGRAALAEDQGRAGAMLGTGAMTLAQNFSTKDEVDTAFARALAAGAKALKAPEDVFWGGYSGYFADPDGHVWELAMNPFWPLNADGSSPCQATPSRFRHPPRTPFQALPACRAPVQAAMHKVSHCARRSKRPAPAKHIG